MQTPGIQFDIRMIRGFRNILFGGEGLFLAELRGPGTIWLQSMPIMNLAEEIGRHLPGKSGDSGSSSAGTAIGGAVIGGLIGGLFNGGNGNS